MQFSLHSTGGAPTQVYDFLLQNKSSVRYLSLHNPNWSFPAEAVSIRSLTHLDFQGIFPGDSRAFADILANGHQLESLRLECHLECTASTQFREHPTALPFLHHFAFSLIGYRVNDHDLFPAISEFLRDRRSLKTLVLSVPSANWAQKRLGYDAGVWGVLPSLTELKTLTATLPKDVAAAVAMWLVPRGVTALSLQAEPSTDALGFVSVRPPDPRENRDIVTQPFNSKCARASPRTCASSGLRSSTSRTQSRSSRRGSQLRLSEPTAHSPPPSALRSALCSWPSMTWKMDVGPMASCPYMVDFWLHLGSQ